MFDIYFLTRLDSIRGLLCVAVCFSILFLVVGLVGYFNMMGSSEGKSYCSFYERCWKKLLLLIVFSAFGLVFIPTTRDAFLIWGIGSVVDYVRENPYAKGLPDKCVKALNRWVDSFGDDGNGIVSNNNKRKED